MKKLTKKQIETRRHVFDTIMQKLGMPSGIALAPDGEHVATVVTYATFLKQVNVLLRAQREHLAKVARLLARGTRIKANNAHHQRTMAARYFAAERARKRRRARRKARRVSGRHDLRPKSRRASATTSRKAKR